MLVKLILQFQPFQIHLSFTLKLVKNLHSHFHSNNLTYKLVMLLEKIYTFLYFHASFLLTFYFYTQFFIFAFSPLDQITLDFQHYIVTYIMKISNAIKYSITLSFTKLDFNRKRDMIVHHGLMGSSKNFNSLCKNSHISNYVNSYLIDSRNHGNSPHTSSHSIQDLASDLYDFIKQNHLHLNCNLTLMGHSMGGMALMKFTQRYPEMQRYINRIILIDIYCSQKSNRNNSVSTGMMLKNMKQINLNQPTRSIYKEIQKRALNKDIAGLFKSNIKMINQQSHQWIPNLETIVKDYFHLNSFSLQSNLWRKPIDLIYGDKSDYVNNYEIDRYCFLYPQMKKQQNFHKIEEAGHWVHFENTSAFLKQMNILLKKDEVNP